MRDLRRWKPEDETSLKDVLDQVVSQGTTLPMEAARMIANKIGALARSIGLESSKDLLLEWEKNRGLLDAAKEQGNNAPRRRKRRQHKRQKRSTGASKKLSYGSEIESEAESQSSLSSTPSDLEKEAVPKPTEVQQSSNTTVKLTFPARRAGTGRTQWEPNPSNRYVFRTLDKILEKMTAAIQSLLKAVPVAILTGLQLTADIRDLSTHLVEKSTATNADFGRYLTTLFQDSTLSVTLILQAYAAAAVYAWVFQRFDCDLDPQIKLFLYTLGQHNPQQARSLEIDVTLDHLERKVKPTLPLLAAEYYRKLLEIFLNLKGPDLLPQNAKLLTTEERDVHMKDWQIKVLGAFQEALELRLRLEQSQCPYTFRWATHQAPFDSTWMESAHEDDASNPTEGSVVLLCLRPALHSCARREGEEPLLVVPALVMLEGAGPPCPIKIDFGSIR
ncbi:hypothetical protein HRR90_001595 [Exophiala dermatitidis]|uniref:Uncharacterized protein n=1 Tax=Exophiala dermatitidis TaxID=5970 RepID=A0AAN6EZS9_EXODE|nr:hypothetical protein HRR74_003867 [Exophiala dermatitidis]KAJ4522009.1 hypothetical protein HRR73_003208 [Exophiala dermatitidis]KAJ4551858.1 hypothetical protein HRR77_003080 [Exophiala dermatitidis]KAJ4569594.1 hypothetical protein HRR79_004435 [Exophiala dermatitidis]KAJ4596953.1 hypothetical protein HRR84_004964 [Exophiala dermatitidis]